MNTLEWYNKLARHCEDTKQLGSIQYKQLELLAEFIAKEEAAQQNMHLTIGSLRYLQETLTSRQLSALKDLFTPPNGK